MMLKYALAILLILALVFTWAFLPTRYLPGNRARHLRIRLHLRLHPGKGFAHLAVPPREVGLFCGEAGVGKTALLEYLQGGRRVRDLVAGPR